MRTDPGWTPPGRRHLAVHHPARLDCREMGRQGTHLCADAGDAVLGVCFRIHCFTQRSILHLESNSSARSNRDDVVGRLLDRSGHLELADQRRGYIDAYPDCLSFRR